MRAPCDEIVYVLEEGRVAIMKAQPLPVDDPFVTFSEWDGEADRKAYAELSGRHYPGSISYTDRSTRQRRPALVISAGRLGEHGRLIWVAMITSAEKRGWPGDLSLGSGYRQAGLPARSVIQECKVATIEVNDAEPLGHIAPDLMAEVLLALRRSIGLA